MIYGDEYPDIAKKYLPNQTVGNTSAQTNVNLIKNLGNIVKDLRELEEIAKERGIM